MRATPASRWSGVTAISAMMVVQFGTATMVGACSASSTSPFTSGMASG